MIQTSLASLEIIDKIIPMKTRGNEPMLSVECAVVKTHRVVVLKGLFQVGDKCVFVRTGAEFPKWAAVIGRSEGGSYLRHNKYVVKNVKFHGVVSQGLVLHPSVIEYVDPHIITGAIPVGGDVSACLGLRKHEKRAQ